VTLTVTNAQGSDQETRIGLITVASAPGGGGSVLSFSPVADAHVKSTSPTTNYGKLTTIRLLAGTTIYRTYLKFDVSGLAGPVASAKLRLYVTDASPVAGRVYSAGSGWTETGIKWNNAPAIAGSPLTSVAAAAVGTWVEFDVSGAITANGLYTFALTTTSTNSVIYSSREGAQPPALVITAGASRAATRGVPVSGRSAGLPLGTTQAVASGRAGSAILAADNSLPSSRRYQILCPYGVAA
jgi:PKD repeat protein